MNAFLDHTGLFNAYIALDPSLWWDDQRWIKKNEDELAKHNFNKKSLFIAIANNMPAGEDTVSVLKDTSYITMIPRAVIPFVHFLRSSKPAGLRWRSKFYPDERHGTVELVSEYDALRYLFYYYSLSTAELINRPEISFASVLVDHYKMISQKLGYNVEPTEAQVNDYAYSCMELGRWNDAYKLFRMNTENHPQSSNAFDSLGDYYAARGDKPHAIEAYTQSLRLHETEDTRRKLNEMKK
ncbi:MAG: hypothetical protein JST19_16950 [Bacteroidetes bacterium]|nr:hypothetical protein [Bacteroidota bacterium]